MGGTQSQQVQPPQPDQPVTFDHFQILRSIGRGSFGKVCIVERKGTGRLFAMKYMNKDQCKQREALGNVLREVQILTRLEHPFLANLWFSFQDEEDLFMVTELFVGGDLRYHIQQRVQFSEKCAWLYVLELALALDYLRSKSIVHRDVKPDNVLLDDRGHAHLTDFNIATELKDGQLATSMSGTKPYMAPEVFGCAADECSGYDFSVDWWSLGVCAYEMLTLFRPYDIHSTTPVAEVLKLFEQPLGYPTIWSRSTVSLLTKLLAVDSSKRLTTIPELTRLSSMAEFNVQEALDKKVIPPFKPPSDHLNCDPSLELEEMMIETKPLHKKKKRLAKQRSLQATISVDVPDYGTDHIVVNYPNYNREHELLRRERVRKEEQWEQELLESMQLAGQPSGDEIMEPSSANEESDTTSYRYPGDSARCQCQTRSTAYQTDHTKSTKIVTPAGTLKTGEEDAIRKLSPTLDIRMKFPKQGSSVTLSAEPSARSYQTCIRPGDCARAMKSTMDEAERTQAVLSKQDDIKLHRALNEAMASFQAMKTFDDVEELLEIQAWDDVQKRLQMLIREKRLNLARREARRVTELEARKMDFHRRIFDHMNEDAQERMKARSELMKMLSAQGVSSNNATLSGVNNVTAYDKFNPGAESTRLMARPQGGLPRGFDCTCDESTTRSEQKSRR